MNCLGLLLLAGLLPWQVPQPPARRDAVGHAPPVATQARRRNPTDNASRMMDSVRMADSVLKRELQEAELTHVRDSLSHHMEIDFSLPAGLQVKDLPVWLMAAIVVLIAFPVAVMPLLTVFREKEVVKPNWVALGGIGVVLLLVGIIFGGWWALRSVKTLHEPSERPATQQGPHSTQSSSSSPQGVVAPPSPAAVLPVVTPGEVQDHVLTRGMAWALILGTGLIAICWILAWTFRGPAGGLTIQHRPIKEPSGIAATGEKIWRV